MSGIWMSAATTARFAVAGSLMTLMAGGQSDPKAGNTIVKQSSYLALPGKAGTPLTADQHLVANGASELLVQVFGDGGAHVRAAFGVAQVPSGSCVEIDFTAEVDEK